jgi:hypothetical protein
MKQYGFKNLDRIYKISRINRSGILDRKTGKRTFWTKLTKLTEFQHLDRIYRISRINMKENLDRKTGKRDFLTKLTKFQHLDRRSG